MQTVSAPPNESIACFFRTVSKQLVFLGFCSFKAIIHKCIIFHIPSYWNYSPVPLSYLPWADWGLCGILKHTSCIWWGILHGDKCSLQKDCATPDPSVSTPQPTGCFSSRLHPDGLQQLISELSPIWWESSCHSPGASAWTSPFFSPSHPSAQK